VRLPLLVGHKLPTQGCVLFAHLLHVCLANCRAMTGTASTGSTTPISSTARGMAPGTTLAPTMAPTAGPTTLDPDPTPTRALITMAPATAPLMASIKRVRWVFQGDR
jgi:hypothetical protein